jgi:arylformamidase
MRFILAFLLLCSGVSAAEPLSRRDLAYTEPKDEQQTVDVYAPADGKDCPIVFWIHGGGWNTGDKADVDGKPAGFTERGYVFVSINYRLLSDKVTIKQMASDVAKAIHWTCDHAQEFGADPRSIFVMGHAAGAQLAALICTDHSYLEAETLKPSIIKGCVTIDADAFDVPLRITSESTRDAEIMANKFGTAEQQKDLSPITHIADGKVLPPFEVIYCADYSIAEAQANRFFQALKSAGASADARRLKDTPRAEINSDLGLPLRSINYLVFGFLDEITKSLSENARGS